MDRQYTYWQDGKFFLGYLNDYPDYITQAFSLQELKSSLASLFEDMASGEVPYIRHEAVLELA